MEVYCLQEDALYALIDAVLDKYGAKLAEKEERWVTEDIAMQKLNVKSKTTMQTYRNEGRIRYSQPDKRIILYDVQSIYAYLEKHAKDTF
jgi:hypothetical protein